MEAAGATASIVGIVSFGLGLAKSLQAFIDSVIEAEETIILIVADVNSTTSTLKDLQDFIDYDKAASKEQNRTTVFNATSIKEISACALQCQKIYVQIIILIEKASIQVGEDGSKETRAQNPAADDLSTPAARLAVFSEHVAKFGCRMRWPWLEPRMRRCQEHLGRLKASLMLRLLVASIAGSRIHSAPPVASMLGTNDENEIRDRAERLRERVAGFQAKQSSPNQSIVRPPGWGDGVREMTAVTSRNGNASTAPADFQASLHSITTDSSSESSDREKKPRRSRTSRAVRSSRVFKVYARGRSERKASFKKDSTSTVFEAYLIYPFPAENPSVPPVKLPFGHRRLTREVTQALRKCSPWNILLVLSPPHRVLVDRVVEQVQLAANGSRNVCLVAIDIDGKNDIDLSDFRAGALEWTRMVLFFRSEPVTSRRKRTKTKSPLIRALSDFATEICRFLLCGWRMQAKRSHEREEFPEIAELPGTADLPQRLDTDKDIIERTKAELEEAKKTLQGERTQIEQERNAVETKNRELGNAEEAILESIEKGTTREELKNIFKEVRAMNSATDEEAAKKASEDKLPVYFKDAVGRKFSFPFRLIQTWEGMDDFIKQAFNHVDLVGSDVQEGQYDLIDSEGQIILPSAWAAIIRPGASVSMVMREAREWPQPPQRTSPRVGRQKPGTPPYYGGPGVPAMPTNQKASAMPGQAHAPFAESSRRPLAASVLRRMSRPLKPEERSHELSSMRHGGRHRMDRTSMPPTRPSQSYHEPWLVQRDPVPRNNDREDLEDIDKELGLDDLETAGQIASKDIDELLAAWTNPASGEGNDGPPPLSS